MGIRVIKPQIKGIFQGNEVAVLEESRTEYFIYLKNVVCGFVSKEDVKLIEEKQK
jgi:phenolic acid decarboxylase